MTTYKEDKPEYVYCNPSLENLISSDSDDDMANHQKGNGLLNKEIASTQEETRKLETASSLEIAENKNLIPKNSSENKLLTQLMLSRLLDRYLELENKNNQLRHSFFILKRRQTYNTRTYLPQEDLEQQQKPENRKTSINLEDQKQLTKKMLDRLLDRYIKLENDNTNLEKNIEKLRSGAYSRGILKKNLAQEEDRAQNLPKNSLSNTSSKPRVIIAEQHNQVNLFAVGSPASKTFNDLNPNRSDTMFKTSSSTIQGYRGGPSEGRVRRMVSEIENTQKKFP